jgi:predicted phage gp36 major capsid-like protein
MEFVNDPRKAKIAFVIVLVLAIIFFLGSGVLGYFYLQKSKSYNSLADNKSKLEASVEEQIKEKTAELEAKLQTDTETLRKEKTDCEADRSAKEDQIDSYRAGMAKVTAYKEFLKYYNAVIEAHNGYTGWTDQEYAIGREKAVVTGDQDFIDIVDYAWNETSVYPVTRVIRVNKAIVTGLERGIK